MLILALESTATVASVALAEDDRVLYTAQSAAGLTHSTTLLPMVESALAVCEKTVDQIDLFAATAGPGSFTGVRIGAAVLKGLAFGKNKPLVSVSTLESLAHNLTSMEGIACAVMDARRGQVYTALFRLKNGAITRLTEDMALSLEDLAERLKEYADTPIYLVGDGYGVARSFLPEKGLPLADTPRLLRMQSAASTALVALGSYQRGETTDDLSFVPTYLRMPQAERTRLAKESTAN